ncbi:hypothetical protein CEXT_40061 [Caerostris extrusa]|uniref:Uncharacterized protein n=1 Tax=Caerostris extrusa TaxID=172846 RepID=A0AAV4MQ31_CAEEX|nr:hypothetical protein CEXT_40061 [Caerostris extrusa]
MFSVKPPSVTESGEGIKKKGNKIIQQKSSDTTQGPAQWDRKQGPCVYANEGGSAAQRSIGCLNDRVRGEGGVPHCDVEQPADMQGPKNSCCLLCMGPEMASDSAALIDEKRG